MARNQYFFQDWYGYPIPRLNVDRHGQFRTVGGDWYDLKAAAKRYDVSTDTLRDLWTTFFADLAGRGENLVSDDTGVDAMVICEDFQGFPRLAS